MRVTITARHCNLTPELRNRVGTVMDRLGQRTPFAQGATVVLDESAGRATTEIRFRLSGGSVLLATSDADDHRTALDRSERKIRRQLERPVAKPSRRRAGARQP